MHAHEIYIQVIRRDAEHAAAAHRLAREAVSARRSDPAGGPARRRWTRFVAWMSRPASTSVVPPTIGYPITRLTR